jgi:hypothetical protein
MTAIIVRQGDRYAAVQTYFGRRDAAIAWRRDNARNPLRDVLWRSFRTGALWTVRRPNQAGQRDTVGQALDAAERAVPFGP